MGRKNLSSDLAFIYPSNMDDKQYEALYLYINDGKYPLGYSKSEKFVLRRSSKNFLVQGEQLFYISKRPDGTSFNRLVLCGQEEAERAFLECHLTTGGHRGRDATTSKIKERYYWPLYYKEIEEKVCV